MEQKIYSLLSTDFMQTPNPNRPISPQDHFKEIKAHLVLMSELKCKFEVEAVLNHQDLFLHFLKSKLGYWNLYCY